MLILDRNNLLMARVTVTPTTALEWSCSLVGQEGAAAEAENDMGTLPNTEALVISPAIQGRAGYYGVAQATVYNADSVIQTLEIKLYRTGTRDTTLLWKGSVDPGDTWVLDSEGRMGITPQVIRMHDENAIHDNVAAEIVAIAPKVLPVSSDIIVIEDSADDWNKKRVTFSDLPAGSEVNALEIDGAAGILSGEFPIGSGADAVLYQKISALTEEPTPSAGDWILGEDALGNVRKYDVGNISATEINDLEADGTNGILIGEFPIGTGTDAVTYQKISALTEEIAPATGDWILGEDASGNVRKYNVGNMPAGAEINALEVDGTAGILTGEFPIGTGANAVTYQKISVLPEELTPTSGDWILGEDASGNVRKYDVGNMPAGSEVNDLETDGTRGILTGEFAVGTGTDAVTYQKISAITEEPAPTAGDWLLGEEAGAGLVRRFNVAHFLGAGTLSETLVTPVRKGSPGTLAKGQPVYVSGYNPSGFVEVEAANASSASTMPAIGLANEAITNSSTGYVVVSGIITGFNTSSFSVNDEIYVDTTVGTVTNVRPTGSTDVVQAIAIVLRSHNSQGSVEVIGAGQYDENPNVSTNYMWKGDGSNHATEVPIGIADDNIVEVDGSPSSGEYARFTANGIEGRTAAELRSDSGLIQRIGGITFEDATGLSSGDRIVLAQVDEAVTISGINFCCLGGTSIAFTIESHTSIASGGTTHHSDTCATTTPEYGVAPSASGSVAADRIIMAVLGTVTGTVTQFHCTIDGYHT